MQKNDRPALQTVRMRSEDTQSNMLTCGNDRHKTEHEKKKKKQPTTHHYRAKGDGLRLTLSRSSQHNLHPTKYGISENNWAIVLPSIHGTVCTAKTMQTRICLELVAQKQDKENNGQKVFVTESQKLIAAYLHSEDHTRC